MGNLDKLNIEITKDIPERFRNEAVAECKKFPKGEWRQVKGLKRRGKFFSSRLNDCYRVLMYPKESYAGVYTHDNYERKIENLKKRGF